MKAIEVDEHTALLEERKRGSTCEIFYSSPVVYRQDYAGSLPALFPDEQSCDTQVQGWFI
jgi:hypothetical protein